MSEIDNPYEAIIRWPCGFCGVRAGEPCHVKGRPGVLTSYLHARRGYVLRKILRNEFYRGVQYERSSAELRALRAAQQDRTMAAMAAAAS